MSNQRIMYKYPSTPLFNKFVKNIKSNARHHNVNLDDLQFILQGTVKLHGTNCSVVVTRDGDYYSQSRENILNEKQNNYNFYQFSHEDKFKELMLNFTHKLFEENKEIATIVIYGELAGYGIQKNVAISQAERFFSPFAVRLVKTLAENEEPNALNDIWLDNKDFVCLHNEEVRVFPVGLYQPYQYVLNFQRDNLKQSSNDLAELTEKVAQEDPFATKVLGIKGLGEGVVWELKAILNKDNTHYQGRLNINLLKFKVKSKEFSVVNHKDIASIDVDPYEKVDDFVEYAVTENRLLQGIEHLKEKNLELEIKNISTFIKWVLEDVLKEEDLTLKESGLTPKEVTKTVCGKARSFFVQYLDNLLFEE